MRILIATGLYAPQIGGPATYTAFLESHLASRGITFEVVPYSSVARYPFFLRHAVYCIQLLRRARSCDFFYALDTVSVGFPVLIASRIARVPYLLRVPGDYAWEQGQTRFGITDTLDTYRSAGKLPLPVRILSWIQTRVARGAQHVVVPSEYLKRVVLGWGVPKERVTRIYSALKEVAVADERGELRRRFGYEGFVITSAARLVPWKGMGTLIDAVHKLRREGLPVSLSILGDGVCYEALTQQVVRLNAEAYITLRGSVSREELVARIKASDAFVLNTAYEGLSHQLIEVMHCTVPIITTNVGGNPELIVHQESGLLIPYDDVHALLDSLRRYINDAGYALKLAQNAHARTQAFHEKVVIEEILHFFSEREKERTR